MSSSDKTMNKLLDSMRMSKQGAAGSKAAGAGAAPATGGQSATAKKTASKKAAPRKKAPVKKPPAARAGGGRYSSEEGRATVPTDSYQSPGRVWPD